MARRTNRRGGKPQTKSKGSSKFAEDAEDKDLKREKKPGNDPAWYASNPEIMRDAASYPFSYNTGATEIHDASVWTDSAIEFHPADQIAGVCSLKVHPVVGTAHYATDPVNVAAQSVYSFVRHANSGHSNYDPADLMIYILAMANMYSFLVWAERLYGYALTYDQRNRYLPNELISTNNVQVSSLIDNLANFRFWINTLVAKMVSFAVPATMSIFSRLSFLFSDYYLEGTSIKEQLYQYVPAGFYKFELDSNQLGKLTWKPFNYSTPMTVSDIITYGEDLFNAIWSQEDFGIMSGDILKAYGDRIIKLAPIPEYYQIVPKFDPIVLTQMKNADIISADISDIAQDPNDGTILQALVPVGISASSKWYGVANTLPAALVSPLNKVFMATIKDYRILTVDTDTPTPDIVMEATRLKVVYNTAKAWYVAGTEVVEEVMISSEPGTVIPVPPIVLGTINSTGEAQITKAITGMLEAARNFHYMPRIWLGYGNNDGNKSSGRQMFDIDNFTLLTYEDVRKLHEAATINMMAVPSIGKV